MARREEPRRAWAEWIIDVSRLLSRGSRPVPHSMEGVLQHSIIMATQHAEVVALDPARPGAPTIASTVRPSRDSGRKENTIQVKLQNLDQFFNTIDPSPFQEKDLDDDLEQFIVSWAREYPPNEPIRLVVHLENPQPAEDACSVIERAVHNYFAYKAESTRRELRQLFRAGRISLIIGVSFLTICLMAAEVLVSFRVPATRVLRESLTIAGWVAMWHPMEVYLYGWWPLRRTERVYRKLSRIPVEVRCNQNKA